MREPKATSEWLRAADFARQTGLSTSMAYKLVGQGRLDGRRVGRALLISRESCDRFLAETREGSAS